MQSGAQSLPPMLLISAPISESGFMIRPIGRFFIDSSPVRVVVKFCADNIPLISLVVVPLLPQSSVLLGAFSPCIPFPLIVTLSPSCSISTPIALKQLIVDRQSAPERKPLT